jgi:cell division protein FtsZ
MNNAGTALMGIGIGQGKTAAQDAAAAAISSPLLDSTIENAKGVVFNISGGPNLSLNEVNQAAKLIYSTVEADANVIFGALVDDTLEDNISITGKNEAADLGVPFCLLITLYVFHRFLQRFLAKSVLATGFSEGSTEDAMMAMASLDDFNDVVASNNNYREDPPVPAPVMQQVASNDKIPGFLKNLKKRR